MMDPGMRGDRPQNLLALAVATLALALVVWWAWDTFTGSEPEPGNKGTADIPPTWLEPDPEPKQPARKPELQPSPPKQPELRPPPPEAEPPPERIQPEVVQPGEEPQPQAEPMVLPPEERERPSAKRPDFSSPSFREWLLGGVARVSARASQEVRVPEGTAVIGSPRDFVRGLQVAPRVGDYVGLLSEVPVHRVRLDEYLIDRFELRNHLYLGYLWSTAQVFYNTSDHPPRTLAEIVRVIVPERPAGPGVVERAARQLYMANRLVLLDRWKAYEVRDREGVIDVDRTYERVKDRDVPGDVRLAFFSKLPPATWPGAIYDVNRGDYPVRGVSLLEAVDYALYRGRHVPTEQQWEYAARGPKGLRFPWDSRGRGFDDNVNGGKALRRGDEPETRPVTHFPGGASWIGCFNMLGNVSEYTSSWRDPYPGSGLEPGIALVMDSVVRGGSAFDRTPWDLRPSLRGWRADDPAAAPRPDVRRAWTGIRTARWEEPGRSCIPAMHVRARHGARLRPAALEPRIFEGWQGHQREVFERVYGQDNHGKPPAGIKSLVAQPLQVVSVRAPTRPASFAPNPDVAFDALDKLVLASTQAPVLLGLVHTDLHVLDLWATGDAPAFFGGGAPTRLQRVDMPPGTYFVAVLNGFVGFLRTDLQQVYYISNRPAPRGVLNVIERAYPAGTRRIPTVSLQLAGGARADLALVVPMHADASPGYAAIVRIRFAVDRRETALVESFERGRLKR
ncbi:MAG: SUMF1/EgtB/PvdO family nonheme iron enzyme [Planctomycetota bacterium]|nr:SUMF1/EgtB/PvdO family nonheme iron enzyme [Planctomycetota bacterium]